MPCVENWRILIPDHLLFHQSTGLRCEFAIPLITVFQCRRLRILSSMFDISPLVSDKDENEIVSLEATCRLQLVLINL